MQWKTAFNEAVFGKGSSAEPPKDDALLTLLRPVQNLTQLRVVEPRASGAENRNNDDIIEAEAGRCEITSVRFFI